MKSRNLGWKFWIGILVYAGILLGIEPGFPVIAQTTGTQGEVKPVTITVEQCKHAVHLTVDGLGQSSVDIAGPASQAIDLDAGTLVATFPIEKPFHVRVVKVEGQQYTELTFKVGCPEHPDACNIVDMITGHRVLYRDHRSMRTMLHEEEESASEQQFTKADDPTLGAWIEISEPKSAPPAKLEGTIRPLAEPVEIPLNLPERKPEKKQERKSLPYRGPTALAQEEPRVIQQFTIPVPLAEDGKVDYQALQNRLANELGSRLKSAERRLVAVTEDDEEDLLNLKVDVKVSKHGQVRWNASTKGDVHISQVLKFLELLNPTPPVTKEDTGWVPAHPRSKPDEEEKPEVIEGTLLEPGEPAPDPNSIPARPSRLPRY